MMTWLPFQKNFLFLNTDLGMLVAIPPLGPVLPKVDAIPQLFGTECAVSEDEIITALSERGHVVVRIWEDDGVVLLSLLEEMIGSLIARTGHSVRIDARYHTVMRWLTPVPTPPWLCASLIAIVNIPSAKFSIIAFQDHFETVTPTIAAGLTFTSGIVEHTTEPDFTDGEEPFPDEVRLNVITLITLLQSMRSENSIQTLTLLGF